MHRRKASQPNYEAVSTALGLELAARPTLFQYLSLLTKWKAAPEYAPQ